MIRKILILILIGILELTSFPLQVLANMSTANPAESGTAIQPNVAGTGLPKPQTSLIAEDLSLFSANMTRQTGQSAGHRSPASFRFSLKKTFRANEAVDLALNNPDGNSLSVKVETGSNEQVNTPVTQITTNGVTTVSVKPIKQFKPGIYKVLITDATGKQLEQDFTWGVLALNVNKSIYTPGETAKLGMAVLNETGNMVCDAKVELRITKNPPAPFGKGGAEGGGIDTLSTANGRIIVNPSCHGHEFTQKPDYEASYQVGAPGTYNMTLSASTPKGDYQITDAFEVEQAPAFEIERSTATRIYPPYTYPVTFTIKANQDFDGSIKETIPAGFIITPFTPRSLGEVGFASGSASAESPQPPLPKGKPEVRGIQTSPDTASSSAVFGVETSATPSATPKQNVLFDGSNTQLPSVLPSLALSPDPAGNSQSDQSPIPSLLNDNSGLITAIRYPFNGSYPLTQHFGDIPDDPLLWSEYKSFGLLAHDGIDFGLPEGTPILAADSGMVLFSGAGDYGNTIVLQHAWGRTYYGHLSVISAQKGKPVQKGDKIGLSGSTGLSTGPHLHFGTRPNNYNDHNGFYGKVDPMLYLTRTIGQNVLGASDTATQPQNLTNIAEVTYPLKIKKGETVTLTYKYRAPQVSPQFYLLGPLRLVDTRSGSTTFEETRQWQVAVDALWLNPNWYYRKAITIDHNKVSASAPPSMPTAFFMESGGDATRDLSFWNGVNNWGTNTVDNTIHNTGPYSIKLTYLAGTGDDLSTPTAILPTAGRISFYVNYNSLPGSTNHLLSFYNLTTFASNPVTLNAAHQLQCSDGATHGTNTLSAGTWYRISTGYTLAGTTLNNKIYLNGNLEVTCTNNTTVSSPDNFGIGADVSGLTIHIDDIYADSGNDQSDTGDIRITNKRPFANGATNNFTGVGTPGAYGSGNARYTNEQPLNSTDYVNSTATLNLRENYSIEAASAGDVDISNVTLLADGAWIYASTTFGACLTAYITNNGTDILTGLPTTPGIARGYLTNSSYPSGNQAVGMTSCANIARITNLFEAGMLIAYNPTPPSTSIQNFPVEVSLPNDPDLAANARSDGYDIVFTPADGSTKLAAEREKYQINPTWCNDASPVVCNSSWTKRKKITFNNSASATDLTNFPVLVNLSSSNFTFASARADGYDIVFTDSSGNTLNFEREKYDGSTTGIFWVNVPVIHAGSTTDSIYMYYSNPAASSDPVTTAVKNATWNSNYEGVWHLKEDPSGTAPQMKDSTSNNNGGTSSGMTSGNQVAGQIDGSLSFSSSTQMIDSGSGSSLDNLSNITIDTWIYPGTNSGAYNRAVIAKADGSGLGNGWLIYYDGTNKLLGFTASCSQTNDVGVETANNAIQANQWQHIVVTWDQSLTASHIHIYINGTEATYGTSQNGAGTYNSDASSNVTIGEYTGHPANDNFVGTIDDTRISNSVRSTDWIKAEYLTESNTMNTFESEESYQPSSTANLVAWVNVPNLSISVDTVIYMYYGNPSSCDETLSTCIDLDGTKNSQTVWNANYKGVWHMSQNPGAGWDLSVALYASSSVSVGTQDSIPRSIFFSPDGTKMYMLGSTNDYVYQYTLSSPWNVSTASYSSKNMWVGGTDGGPRSIYFSPDGTKMYMLGNNFCVYQYTLSTPWDVSTANFPGNTYIDVSAHGGVMSLSFSSDGTKMYFIGTPGHNIVFQYSLSSAWDVTTATDSNKNFSVASQDSSPNNIKFSSDGTKMFMTGSGNQKVYQYTMPTPWDVSTASYSNISFYVGSQDSTPIDIYFSSNGTIMYMMGDTSNAVYQYTLSQLISDSTSNANNGTPINMNSGNQVVGKIDGSLNFDGSSNYIQGPMSSSIDPGGTKILTYETWYKTTNSTLNQILGYTALGSSNGYRIAIDGDACTNQFRLEKDNGSRVIDCVGTVPADTNWHYLVIVASATGVSAYVDGVLSSPSVAESSNFVTSTANHFYFGNNSSNTWLSGGMDETRIIMSAENAGWITTEYNNQYSPATFYTLGIQECYPTPVTNDRLMRHGEYFSVCGRKAFTW